MSILLLLLFVLLFILHFLSTHFELCKEAKLHEMRLCPPSGQTIQYSVGSSIIRNQEPRESMSAQEAVGEILDWEWRWGACWRQWQYIRSGRTGSKRIERSKASKTAVLITLILLCRSLGNLTNVRCSLLSLTASPISFFILLAIPVSASTLPPQGSPPRIPFPGLWPDMVLAVDGGLNAC